MSRPTNTAIGAAGGKERAIGKSRGGNTTKIHLVTDAFGLPIEFETTGGEVHDYKMAMELVSRLPQAGYVIEDKGYDSEPLREKISGKKG